MGNLVHIIFDISTHAGITKQRMIIEENIYLHGVGLPLGRATNKVKRYIHFCKNLIAEIENIHKHYGLDLIAYHSCYAIPTVKYVKNGSCKNVPIVYHTYAALPFELGAYIMHMTLNERDARTLLDKISKYFFFTMFERTIVRMADAIIVASPATIYELYRAYGIQYNKVFVVPLGQDFSDYYKEMKRKYNIDKLLSKVKKKKVILFVGNDWHRKGVLYLLKAFKRILPLIPDVELIMTGPPQEPFVSLAYRWNIRNNIKFVGNVDKDILVRLYMLCDVFVLPSFHEGFSNTVLEAMAFGKPVVTSFKAGYPLVKHGVNGFLCKPHEYEKIADYICMLLTDDDLYKRVSSEAAKTAERYTWDKVTLLLLKVYEGIISGEDERVSMKRFLHS